jgi:hypothetical protein
MEDNGEDEDKKLTLLDLSDDPIYLILSQLQLSDLKSATLTNATFRNIIQENPLFRKKFIKFREVIEKIDLRGWTPLQFKDTYKDEYFKLKISGNELIDLDSYYGKCIILEKDYYMYINRGRILIISPKRITILISNGDRFLSDFIYIDMYSKIKKILIGYNEMMLIYLDNTAVIKTYLRGNPPTFDLIYLSDLIVHVKNEKNDKIYMIYESGIVLTFKRGRNKDAKWKYIYIYNYSSQNKIFKEGEKYLNRNRNNIDYKILEKIV